MMSKGHVHWSLNWARRSVVTALAQAHCRRYCSVWIFQMRLLRRGFHTLISMFRSPIRLMWDLTFHPLLGPVSLLTHPDTQPRVHSILGLNFLVGTLFSVWL